MNEECPFCDDSELRERSVVRNEFVSVFPTNIPIVPRHVLITPVRHVATLAEFSPDERTALFDMIERMMQTFRTRFAAQGFNIAWNEGELAGQSVQHLHVHLLPRKKVDTGITQYDPRKFLYRTGSREVSPDNELQAVADEIRRALA